MPHRKPASELTSPQLFFDGGFNYLDLTRVRPNQLVAGRNWFRGDDAVIRPRPGNKVWNAVSLGADFDGLWEYRPSSGVNQLVALAGGTLFKGDDLTKTFSVLLSGLTAGRRGYLAQAQNAIFFCDGATTPRVSDLTTVFRLGIVNPSTAPTVALAGAGPGNLPLEATFYRYTYAREESGMLVRESNPSPESTSVTPTGGDGQVNVTVAASSDAQVTHIYIYRRSTTSLTEYKFVGKRSNTAGIFLDNVAPANLGGFAFWEASGGLEDHGYPPNDLVAITPQPHRDGRLYAWGAKGRLYYTRVNQFHYWPGASGGALGTQAVGVSLIVGEDDGDDPQAILLEGDDVLLLKRQHVYRLLGDGPTDDDGTVGSWRNEQLPTVYGCVAPASAVVGPSGAFWLTETVGPVQVDRRSGLPFPIGEEIFPWINRCVDLTKAVGWVHGWHYFLSLPVSGGRWEIHAYDTRNRSWWPLFDMDATAFCTRESGVLVWGGILEVDKPANGVVYEWDQQVSDNGHEVTAELTTRVIDARVGWWKLLRKTLLACEGNPGASLTARIIPDQSASYVERELKLNALTGVRMLKPFVGTKRLQGWAFQLYLKSASLIRRPAIYYWQQFIHTFNRDLLHTPPFTEAYPDLDPTVAISEGNFGAGSHSNTQTLDGKVMLAEDLAWVLAFDGPYTSASSLELAQGKLILVARDAATSTMYMHIFDGGSWSTVPVGIAGKYSTEQLPYQTRRLIVLAGTVFAFQSSGVSDIKIRRSTDLATWVDYGTQAAAQPRPAFHNGLLWMVEFDAAQGPWFDAGGGNFQAITTQSPAHAGMESYQGLLYAIIAGDLKAWNGSTWTTKYAFFVAAQAGAMRVFSANGKLYVGEASPFAGDNRVIEWDGTTRTVRATFSVGRIREIVELTEPSGRKVLYLCVGDTLYRSPDGLTYQNLQAPVAGKDLLGAAIYKGRRYVGLANGDVYSSLFFKTSGTYRLDERDLGATKTTAQVTIVATIPGGTTLQSRIGYAAVSGGPYTFTPWHTQLTYSENINGRYVVIEFQMTGDGTASPEVDSLEAIFR